MAGLPSRPKPRARDLTVKYLSFCFVASVLVVLTACGSSDQQEDEAGTGGGGAASMSGGAAAGGRAAGGSMASGGSTASSGGATASGGVPASGGAPASGGVNGTGELAGRMTPPKTYNPTTKYEWTAPPADVVVNALAAGGAGAVTLADALAGAGHGTVIRIAPSLAGAVLRTNAPLVVGKSVTLDASQAPGFTIDAGETKGGLRVGRDLHTRFVGLTIKNVRTTDVGGGLYVDQADGAERGSVEVIGCTFENNHGSATGGLYIRRRMNAIVRDSVFRKNRGLNAQGDDLGKAGGAISSRAEGSLRIERVVFVENDSPEAGALYSIGQPLTVIHSVFLDNGGAAAHGAILSDGGSPLQLEGVLLQGNHGAAFGGAIQLYGYAKQGDHVTVKRSVFVDNWTTNNKGGAAYLIGAKIDIESSVFVRNRSLVDAGAIYFPGAGDVRITNSVFGQNVCTSRSGGGFRKDGGGPVTIERSLFAYNEAGESGGGFWMQPTLAVSFAKTIFAENKGGPFVGAAATNAGGNLFFPIVNNPQGALANSTFADPRLGPLTETNGVYWYPLQAGSPAADIGPSFPETQRN